MQSEKLSCIFEVEKGGYGGLDSMPGYGFPSKEYDSEFSQVGVPP